LASSEIASAFVTLRPNAAGFAPAALAQLRPQMQQVNAAMSAQAGLTVHAARGMRDYQRGALAASLAAAGLRGAVLAAGVGFLGGAGLIKGVELFLGVSARFEKSLNTLQAVTHATNAELEEASELAIKLGKDFTLPQTSAEDAAVAMTELARGGLDLNKSMDAARGSLQLAAAAGVDFETAAKIQARALNSFALSGEQAVRVADVLANAANISTGEITDMALSLQQASAVAHAANIPIEDTATAISILANAGLTGSDAGTSLRTMLLRLVPVTEKARDEMASLGVQTTNAAGEILPLQEIINRYHDALARLTPEQRQLSLQTIFGQDAIRASNILFAAGAKVFTETRVQIERQGAAADIAAAKNKGLAGSFDALKSNLESVLIGIGKGQLPGLTSFVRGLNDSVTSLSQSKQAADALRASQEALSAAFHGAGDILRTIGPIIGAVAETTAKLANVLGGGAILAGFLAFKAGAVLARAFNFTLAKVVATQSILNNESQLTRVTMVEQGREVQKLTIANTALVESQLALIASMNAVQEGAAGQVAANTAVAASQAKVISGTDAVVRGLVGQVKGEKDAVKAARALALEQTGLQRSTLARAIASQRALEQSLAGKPVRGAGGRFISREAIQAEADLARGAVQAELAVTKLGSRMSALGSSALAFVGGPLGAISIGLAAVTTAFILFGDRGKSSVEKLDEATEKLAGTIADLAAAQDSLARARLEIKTSALSVEEAKLNLQYAKGEIIQAQSTGSAIRLRAARLNLRRAELDFAQAVKASRDAQRQQLIEEAKTAGQQREIRKDRAEEQKRIIEDLAAAQREALATEIAAARRQTRTPAPPEIITARAVRDHAKALRERAADLRKDEPVLAHQLDLIAELEERTKSAATDREIGIILKVDIAATPEVRGLLLGDVAPSKLPGQESITSALHNRLTEIVDLVPRFRNAGKELGIAFARSLTDNILLDEDVVVRELKAQLANVIAEGKEAIASAILDARSNLVSLGEGLGGFLDQLIDAGPLGSQIAKLTKQLDDSNRKFERIQLQRSRRDTREDLAEAIRSTHSLGPVDAEQQRNIDRFLRPEREAVQDADRALFRFDKEGSLRNLQETSDALKKQTKKDIADLVALYNAGAISAAEFNKRLTVILRRAAPNYKATGKALGVAFVQGFNEQVRGIREQVRLSAPFAGRGPAQRAKTVDPAETIADVLRANAKAQKAVDDAAAKARKRHNELARLTLIELRKKPNAPPKSAVRRAKEKGDFEVAPGGSRR